MLWCQICNHGGHYREIINWFSSNSKCPADCQHNCYQIKKKLPPSEQRNGHIHSDMPRKPSNAVDFGFRGAHRDGEPVEESKGSGNPKFC